MKATICVNCLYHKVIKQSHMCVAEVESAMDFVTGKEYLTRFMHCKERNKEGKCALYQDTRLIK